MDTEKDLMEAFERILHRDFPNPERVGCPPHDVLARVASHMRDPEFRMLLTHIRQCGPCFDEWKQFRRKLK